MIDLFEASRNCVSAAVKAVPDVVRHGLRGPVALVLIGAIGLASSAYASPGPGPSTRTTLTASDRTTAKAQIEQARKERKALEASLKAAKLAATVTERDLRAVTEDLIALALETRRQEDIAARAAERIEALDREAKSLAAQLRADEKALDDMLVGLIALSARRPPAVVLGEGAPRDSVRAALLMGEVAPVLRERSLTLSQSIQHLQSLRRAAGAERSTLQTSEASLQSRRSEVEALVAEKRQQLSAQTDELSRLEMELTTLSREVESLNELLARLPERPKTTNPPKSKMRPGAEQYASAGGFTGAGNFRLGAPTAGKLVNGFGVMLESGRKSFGHIYETRSKAQITTPAQASVLYADALQRDGSFGKVVILEALTGERLVFTGLAGLYIKQGDSVEAGEPIGEMPETDDAAPKLYFEVRNTTGFVNPTQWLNQRKAPS